MDKYKLISLLTKHIDANSSEIVYLYYVSSQEVRLEKYKKHMVERIKNGCTCAFCFHTILTGLKCSNGCENKYMCRYCVRKCCNCKSMLCLDCRYASEPLYLYDDVGHPDNDDPDRDLEYYSSDDGTELNDEYIRGSICHKCDMVKKVVLKQQPNFWRDDISFVILRRYFSLYPIVDGYNNEPVNFEQYPIQIPDHVVAVQNSDAYGISGIWCTYCKHAVCLSFEQYDISSDQEKKYCCFVCYAFHLRQQQISSEK